jgi:L-threonylcarbamoyladenylate synthase
LTEAIKETSPESPQKAASVLKGGGIIIYPTETLCGIGALALNEGAVEKIFLIKGRAERKPIPILVKDKEMLSEVAEITEEACILIERFLPGPLTLVLGEKEGLPGLISSGTGKIAVRISSHSFVNRLFDLLDQPITSTSANISGEENLFNISEIRKTFEGKVELIVDSGNLPPSKGSTVVDLTVNPPSIIREGDISKEELLELLKW